MKGCLKFAMKCSVNAFLTVSDTTVRYEFDKPRVFYRNLLALQNLLITDFSWKPACVHSVCPWLGVSWKQALRAAIRHAQTLAKNSGGFVAAGASSLLGATERCHVDHSQFWKQHPLASSVCNCFSSWIVTKACSWDALPLLGYEAEEHQLSAANPLNSLDKFHWQFLLFESVATSLKVFLCRQWETLTGYGQTGLLGNVPVGSLPWGFRIQALLQSVKCATWILLYIKVHVLANKPAKKLAKPPHSHGIIISKLFLLFLPSRQKSQLLFGWPLPLWTIWLRIFAFFKLCWVLLICNQ